MCLLAAASTTSLLTGNMQLSAWNDNGYMQNYAIAGYLDASYDEAIWIDYIALKDIRPTGDYWSLAISTGTSGSVLPSGTITGPSGSTTPAIRATPNTGYQFSHWLFDGATHYTQNPVSLTIDDTLMHTLVAVFAQSPTWSLIISAGTGGSVTPSSAIGLRGTSVAVTAITNSGFMFSYWLYDGIMRYTQNPITLTINDVSSHTLKAVFTATRALTVTSPDGGESWARGTTHTITWTSTGSLGAYVKIELLNGGIVNRIIASGTANDGSYSWRISSTQTIGTNYKIRIKSTAYSSITDSSNSNFAIARRH